LRYIIVKEAEFSYARISYDAPIVYIEFKEGAELGFGEMREMIHYAEELSGHTPYVALSDVRVDVSVTPMGKKVASDPAAAPLCRGSAIVVKSKMLQAAANFYTVLNPSPHPFKAFTDKQAAIHWLSTLSL